ncbi:F-box/kelch-repeat protein [Senna tora]|uniref:F-box/kelch-repeat protein n=1 Tax=Senna tora TaxID=362788 RepID=A0A834TS19_9FABA|nr:F-box/kelch-repeat protein [Senna tora]
MEELFANPYGIPSPIICCIFAKLDAKNLYRVRAVYKKWYMSCVDPVFIDKHAAGSKSPRCTHVIACYLRPLDSSSLGIYQLNIDYNNQLLSDTFLDLPKYLKHNNVYFIGLEEGVFCFRHLSPGSQNDLFYLCNPTMHQCLQILTPQLHVLTCYADCNVTNLHEHYVNIDAKLHWLCDEDNNDDDLVITSYDLRQGTWDNLELPVENLLGFHDLLDVGGCLGVLTGKIASCHSYEYVLWLRDTGGKWALAVRIHQPRSNSRFLSNIGDRLVFKGDIGVFREDSEHFIKYMVFLENGGIGFDKHILARQTDDFIVRHVFKFFPTIRGW